MAAAAIMRIAVFLLCIYTCSAINCSVTTYHGCYSDCTAKTASGDCRFALTVTATNFSETNTLERCARYCFELNTTYAAVENGQLCFCGNDLDPLANSSKVDPNTCDATCSGDNAQKCGGSHAMSLFSYQCDGPVIPNYQACVDPAVQDLPFCNASLSIDERLSDLSSRLSVTEKISMIAPQRALGDRCSDHTGGVDRLKIPQYMWLTEVNTAAASACYSPGKCATTFNGPLGFGASFNRTLWYLKGSVIATEMRAFTNLNWHRTRSTDLIGVTGYGPNINIARDPRFGRTSELPGEDPFLSGTYASYFVQGLQEKDQNGYPKIAAYLKHLTAYSRETNRGHDTYNISMHDLWDTYLAQFEIAFKQGQPMGAMCSYNAINGRPSCANDYLLNYVVRQHWNYSNMHITTDCNAIRNLAGPPVNAADEAVAAATAINNGTDLEMGSSFWALNMSDALARDLTTVSAVETAWRRSYRVLFEVGRFDDPKNIEWSKYGLDDINSTYHQQVQYEAASQSLVLLKNSNATLPIANNQTVAVIGPMAVAQAGLLSDYAGDQQCYRGDDTCITTIGDGIAGHNSGRTLIVKGVDVNSTDSSGISAAKIAATESDVVILVLGIDTTIERETLDRIDTALPGLQETLAKEIFSVGKPTILILCNGGALAIDDLINPSAAIIEAFSPSLAGARAIGATIFGKLNKFGKLPYTMYPRQYVAEQNMTNYDMAEYPGRTYRYYQNDPLYCFGTGLSYTQFLVNCTHEQLIVRCDVTNVGNFDGDEVLLVYHSAGDDVRAAANHPVPLRSVVEFKRIHVQKGFHETVEFQLSDDVLYLVDDQGRKRSYSGHHDIIVSSGCGLKTTNDYVFTIVV